MNNLITGIQQIGIGVINADEAKLLYKKDFGMTAKVFEDVAEASLMTKFTGEKVYKRKAILALNMAGGGGFEIWQFLNRTPSKSLNAITLGQPGIFGCKIKTSQIQKAYNYFAKSSPKNITKQIVNYDGRINFWVQDVYDNWFNIIQSTNIFKENNNHCAGVCGAVIAVSDMDKAIHFYSNVLGINNIVYDYEHIENEIPTSMGRKFRKVLLQKTTSNKGAFASLLGNVEIELIQDLESKHLPIYNNRFWGDCGFIHLCFDVLDMDELKNNLQQKSITFEVDSQNSFNMANASGRFCYIKDPDGTLIELVETHKVPVLKKLGIYFNLQKRKHNKPLSRFLISLLGISKIK
jgi:catechol 2,3-dioxygenase-like lactoylglutathione lyase family enzyme